MSELKKQAIADAKIKLENSYPNARYGGSIKTTHEALEICTPQAHESVQNGKCDEVSDEIVK